LQPLLWGFSQRQASHATERKCPDWGLNNRGNAKTTLAKHQPLTNDIDAELERLSAMKARREREQLKDKLGLDRKRGHSTLLATFRHTRFT
jgi:hypothetical protein